MEWAPPDAAKVKRLWHEGEEELIEPRREYGFNKAFWLGNQHVVWDQSDRTVVSVGFTNDTDARSRMKVNLFRNRTNSLIARLVHSDLEFNVEPTDAAEMALRRQGLQEHMLEAERLRGGWEAVRSDEVQAAFFGGTSAVAIEWDNRSKGTLITDPATGDQKWIGGLKLSALSVQEFCVEPGTRSIDDALWWIRATTLTPTQAQRRYNLPEPPKPDAPAGFSPFLGMLSRTTKIRTKSKQVMVFVYYERPTETTPGCCVHVCGDHVESYPWDFPFDCLNMRTFTQCAIDDTWLGDTILSDARQPQVAYNEARTTTRRHMQRAANSRLLYEAGSLPDEGQLTDEVGEVVAYEPNPQGGGGPRWMTPPELSRWIQNEPAQIAGEMDEIFNTHAISRGQQLGDRNSGLALSILAEKDDTPLGPMARAQAKGWGDLGRMALMLLRAKVSQHDAPVMVAPPALYDEEQGEPVGLDDEMGEPGEPVQGPTMRATVTTTVKDKRTKVPVTQTWSADDFDIDPTVRVPLDAVMPRSVAAVRDELVKIAQAFPQVNTVLTAEAVGRVLELPSVEAAFDSLNPDAAKARRENQQLAMGLNCVPDDWDEHAVHIKEHNDFRNSTDYESLPPERQNLVDLHVKAHETMAMEDIRNQTPPESPEDLGGAPPSPPSAPPVGPAPELAGPPEGAPPEQTPPMPQPAAV